MKNIKLQIANADKILHEEVLEIAEGDTLVVTVEDGLKHSEMNYIYMNIRKALETGRPLIISHAVKLQVLRVKEE